MIKQNIILWAAAALCCTTAGAAIRNDWTFEGDSAGNTLDAAFNSGVDGAVFSTDTGGVTQTDAAGGLICANTLAGIGNFWTDGAVLAADVVNASAPEIRFLRYDFDYDVTAINNNSGTLLGLSFSDGASSNLAGVALLYDAGTDTAPPAGIKETTITNDFALTGSISIIAKVNLGNDTIEVWYDLTGSGEFSASANAVSPINLTAIEELEFRATGDFIATASNECAVVENIRTADTWEEITKPLADFSKPPELAIVDISDSMDGVMDIGQTNIVTVVIENTVSPASNVTSLLMPDGAPGAFTIVSNNTPVQLDVNRFATNTYALIANTGGAYLFTAQAFSDETSSAPAIIEIGVGESVSLDSVTVTNDTGGIIDGEVEPGETFDLIITSINDGARTVNGITNSLTAADPAVFPTISPITPTVYSSLGVGSTTSTMYQVSVAPDAPGGPQTFTVINRTATEAWTNSFQLSVFKQPVPSVTPTELTIVLASGETASASFTLANDGNIAAAYSVTDDGAWPTEYVLTAEDNILGWQTLDFDVPDPTFPSWDGVSSTNLDIGFDFPLFGTVHTSFVAGVHGAIGLDDNTTISPNYSGNFNRSGPLVSPFWSRLSVHTNNVRYLRENDRLIVSWQEVTQLGSGGGSGMEFQTWLHADGTIRHLYRTLSGSKLDQAAIGVQNATVSSAVTNVPASGESFLLTPTLAPWVSYNPESGIVAAQGTQEVTVLVDAAGQSVGTNAFTTAIAWSDGSTSDINVTVIVTEAIPALEVTPASLEFSAPAGFISLSPIDLTLSNTGNVTLNYSIFDVGTATNGYQWEKTSYSWMNVQQQDIYRYGFAVGTDRGTTPEIPLSFFFPFYGTVYTNCAVSVDGELLLGGESVIGPYRGDLVYDENSDIRYAGDANRFTVIWENISQKNGGADLTFQAILYRNGDIRFQYDHLSDADRWPFTPIEFEFGDLTTEADLINGDTATFTTNYITVTNRVEDEDWYTVTTNGTNVTVTYDETVEDQAILFQLTEPFTLVCTPLSGMVPPGETASINVLADARGLTDGESVSTRFDVLSEAPTVSAEVTFTATASLGATPPPAAVAAAMWGTEFVPDVSFETNPDGSRTVSWPSPADHLNRTYTVMYTTDLTAGWIPLAIVENRTEYTDMEHMDEPVVFYKVMVE